MGENTEFMIEVADQVDSPEPKTKKNRVGLQVEKSSTQTISPLASKYIVEDNQYFFKSRLLRKKADLAFVDHGDRISSANTKQISKVAEGMIELAKERGWQHIKASGNEEFRTAVQKAVQKAGIEVTFREQSGFKQQEDTPPAAPSEPQKPTKTKAATGKKSSEQKTADKKLKTAAVKNDVKDGANKPPEPVSEIAPATHQAAPQTAPTKRRRPKAA